MPEKRIPPGGEGAMDMHGDDEAHVLIRWVRKRRDGEKGQLIFETSEDVDVTIRRVRKP